VGRHSSSKQGAYYRSVMGWLLPWALIAAVIGTVVWIAVDAVSNDGLTEPKAASSPSPTRTQRASPSPDPVSSESPPPDDGNPDVELIVEGISVQVLNATDVPKADDRMADRLVTLGFSVVAVQEAATPYEETTVFYSTDASKEAAERLAERFGWIVEPRPQNLSEEVSLHVVVGADEAR